MIVGGAVFASFAGDQLELWSRLEGATIQHAEYGSGKIAKVRHQGGILLIYLECHSHAGDIVYTPDGFRSGRVSSIHIPVDLGEPFWSFKKRWDADQARMDADQARKAAEEAAWQVRQAEQAKQAIKAAEELRARKAAEEAAWRAREAASRAEEAAKTRAIGDLAQHFNIPLDKAISLFESLLPILQRLDRGESLDGPELQCLEDNALHNVLATYHYRRFGDDGDLWGLVKACSYLRKAGLSRKAIEISDARPSWIGESQRVVAALLTTRGGAFHDLYDLELAKACAKEAITLFPNSPHAYNLLAAVLYEEGEPSEGDKCFARAMELGSLTRTQEAEIRTALERSEGKVRRTIAAYLLEKNPQKNEWARQYLQD